MDPYADTPGEMEVYPDLSIIGRGKDMQPYSYQRATEVHTGNHGTPNRNTHGPKRKRQPKTLKTPETGKTQPDSPQGGTINHAKGDGRMPGQTCNGNHRQHYCGAARIHHGTLEHCQAKN